MFRSGKIKKLIVHSVGYANTPDEFFVEVLPYTKLPPTPPSYHDVGTGGPMSNNHRIFVVSYDSVTEIIRNIVTKLNGKDVQVQTCVYSKNPPGFLQVKKEIPFPRRGNGGDD